MTQLQRARALERERVPPYVAALERWPRPAGARAGQSRTGHVPRRGAARQGNLPPNIPSDNCLYILSSGAYGDLVTCMVRGCQRRVDLVSMYAMDQVIGEACREHAAMVAYDVPFETTAVVDRERAEGWRLVIPLDGGRPAELVSPLVGRADREFSAAVREMLERHVV